MTAVVGSRTSHQSLERSAGAPEPADPRAYYRVEPGESAPEYFGAGLSGLTDAMARAGWLSVAHGAQQVAVTRPEGHPRLPACTDQVIRAYEAGRETFTTAAPGVMPQAAKPEPAPRRARRPARGSGRPEGPAMVMHLRGI
jgi:hypothetical protein